MTSLKLIDLNKHHYSDIYMMFITRTEHCFPYLKQIDKQLEPEYKIDVDGGTIVKILKIKSEMKNFQDK